MARVRERVLRAGIVWSLLGLAACGGGGGPSAVSPVVATPPSLASVLNRGVSDGLDGVWLFVDAGAGTPEYLAVGRQNRDTLAPAELTSLFKIASISKMFVATAAVRLVDRGTLRLDDTLAFWLPDLAGRIANAESITVRQLLQHRSGVPDFDSQPGFSWSVAHTDEGEVLSLALDLPADFAPDARYEYSNTNYLLLGRILNAALGHHHHEFVQSEILSPLGMTDTYSLLGDTDVALLARGYWNDFDRTEQDYVIPGGSMISTAADTGVFVRALATGALLSAGEQQIYASLFNGYGHSGWLPGYQSQARYYADLGAAVVLLVNTTGGGSETVMQETWDAVVAVLRGR